MTTQWELEHVELRYSRRLDSLGDRKYWRDNHAGQDMGVLLRRIDELQGEIARLEREGAEHARFCDAGMDTDPPDSCQCAVRRNPPCSWCVS